MPFTLIAFSESVDQAALAAIAGVADDSVTVQGDNITVPPQLPNVVGAFGIGPNMTRFQLQSPSLRAFLQPEINPIDVAATPSSPSRFADYRFTPIPLAPNEFLNVASAEDGAGATRMTAGIWLADGPVQPVAGEVRSVRVTGATAVTAAAWSNVTLTFDQNLPAGRYQVVGGQFFSTTMLLWRLAFVGYAWRPGGPGGTVVSQAPYPAMRAGGFGIWGEFQHNLPPVLQAFCTAADAAQTGVLDLVYLGP